MKKFYLIFLLCGCSTTQHFLQKATGLGPERDVRYWVEYGDQVMNLEPEELRLRIINYQKNRGDKSQYQQLEYALLTGLRPRHHHDYLVSLGTFESLIGQDELDGDWELVLNWYQELVRSHYRLYQERQNYQRLSSELSAKLEALSKIETKMQERSERVVP